VRGTLPFLSSYLTPCKTIGNLYATRCDLARTQRDQFGNCHLMLLLQPLLPCRFQPCPGCLGLAFGDAHSNCSDGQLLSPAVDGVNTPSIKYTWTLAVSQLVVLIFQEYICMALDWKYHGVDHFTYWPRNLRRLVIYSFITMTLGGLK
jgi:hypothetical protein